MHAYYNTQIHMDLTQVTFSLSRTHAHTDTPLYIIATI